MITKVYRHLILVWSVVCASGLGIFLFQIYAPAITPQTAYDSESLTMAVGFFVFLWACPVAIVFTLGRRGRD